jgi:hypothetical protein
MPTVDHFHDSFRRPQSGDHNALARRRPGAPIPVPVLQPRSCQNRRQYCQHPFAPFVHKPILSYSLFVRLHKFMICDLFRRAGLQVPRWPDYCLFLGMPEYSCLGERASA